MNETEIKVCSKCGFPIPRTTHIPADAIKAICPSCAWRHTPKVVMPVISREEMRDLMAKWRNR